MIRKLPKEIWCAILPASSLLQLLTHPSRHVRDVALPLLRRDLTDEDSEVVALLLAAAVRCLQLPETRHHASKALDYLVAEKLDEEGEAARITTEYATSETRPPHPRTHPYAPPTLHAPRIHQVRESVPVRGAARRRARG